MANERTRSAQEVFDDHLREGKTGTVEADFARTIPRTSSF